MSLLAELKRRNVIRVAVAYIVSAWLIIEVSTVIFEIYGAPEWLPKVLVALLLLGLPVAVMFSWVYELTPEGIKRESEVPADQSITKQTGRKLDLITIGVVIAGVLFVGADRFLFESRSAGETSTAAGFEGDRAASRSVPTERTADGETRKSIAVLPFDSFSDDPNDAYFANGIHEDILTHLSRVRELRVISRSSVAQYEEDRPPVSVIAGELHVGHVLEGSVRRAGNRVRVTAQLIDARSDEHLWADNYDRELTDIFAIQTEIAKSIVKSLEASLTPEEEQLISSRPTENLEAYDLYLRAREILRRPEYNMEKYIEAEPLLRRAVELDPKFAQAHAMLAEVHGMAVWIGFDRTDARRAAMKAAVDKALEIAPGLPEAQAALAEYNYRIERDYQSAIRHLESAHQQLPGSSDILEKMGLTYRRLGRWDEAVQALERAVDLDPADLNVINTLASTLLTLRRWDEVINLVDPVLDEYPNESDLAGIKGWALLSGYGRIDAAREVIAGRPSSTAYHYVTLKFDLPRYQRNYAEALEVLDAPDVSAYLAGNQIRKHFAAAFSYEALGDLDAAASQFEAIRQTAESRLADQPESSIPHAALAIAHARLGDIEQARAALQRSVEATELRTDHMTLQVALVFQAMAMARLGENDRALNTIEAALEIPGDFSRWDFVLDPMWDFLRDNPRFAELTRVEPVIGE